MTFKYYIFDTNQGCVFGTNYQEIANDFSSSCDYFVINPSENKWITVSEVEEIKDINYEEQHMDTVNLTISKQAAEDILGALKKRREISKLKIRHWAERDPKTWPSSSVVVDEADRVVRINDLVALFSTLAPPVNKKPLRKKNE